MRLAMIFTHMGDTDLGVTQVIGPEYDMWADTYIVSSVGGLARFAGAAAITGAMLIPTSSSVSGAATISGDAPWSPSAIDHGCVIRYVPDTSLLLEQCTDGQRVATDITDPQLQSYLAHSQALATGDRPFPEDPTSTTQYVPGFNASISRPH